MKIMTHALCSGTFLGRTFSLVLILSAPCLASVSEPAITPHVDPRVELVSIVFRLAGGDSDYNKSFLKQYASDIDLYFLAFKTHPAVLLAKKLADRDDFDVAAPMQIAVRVAPPPALEPLRPFTNDFPGEGFDKETALLFLQHLREFYRDTHFEKFLAAHQALYRLAEERFNAVLREVDLNWYSSFYGETQESNYNSILGLNNGGSNYGAQFILGDRHEERFSIIGSWTTDRSGRPTFGNPVYLDTVIHEFNHSFVNPAFERHKADFASAQKVFDQVGGQMRGIGYGNSDEMVYESLVRVNVILRISRLTGWRLHHLVPRVQGGSSGADNRVLLHPECHDKVHCLCLPVSPPRPSHGAFEGPEPDDGKLSRPVLRGPAPSNGGWLLGAVSSTEFPSPHDERVVNSDHDLSRRLLRTESTPKRTFARTTGG